MKPLLSGLIQIVAVIASYALGWSLIASGGHDQAFVGGLIVGGALSIGKKLLGGAAKKEIARVAARGGALSGPVRTALPPMGGGMAGTAIQKVLKGAATVGGAIGIGAAADAAGNALGIGRPRKRYRRQNVTNVKALNRALRRVEGFEKIVRRTFSISGTVKPKKRRSCR